VVDVVSTRTNGKGPRPGELSAQESALRSAFLAEVERIPGGDRLRRCIQCGTCSGSCPVSYAMDVQPRQLVAFFRAGDLESILRSRTIWICASCYACTVRCPSGIKVTDLIYSLKRMALESGILTRGMPTHDLSEQFVRVVNRTGRNQEMELSIRYFLKRSPLEMVRSLPLAWKLFKARRLPWRVQKVKGLEGLRRIIAKAEEMDRVYPGERLESLAKVGYGVVTERPKAAGGGGA
jgi:heterodisulfide reductase subunit C